MNYDKHVEYILQTRQEFITGEGQARLIKDLLKELVKEAREGYVKCEKTSGFEDIFEEAWSNYPRKTGKSKALKIFRRTVGSQEDADNFIVAVLHYCQAAKGKDPQYIKTGGNFADEWMDWVDIGVKEKYQWKKVFGTVNDLMNEGSFR